MEDYPVKVVVDCSGTKRPEDRVCEVPLTKEELEARARDQGRAPKEHESQARFQRDALLAASDWTQLPDVQAAMPEARRAAWRKYRQALRDNPTGPWPEVPR